MIELRARRVWLRLGEEVVVARARERHAEVIQVELRYGSAVGFGEGAPAARFGETPDETLAYLRDPATIGLVGRDPFALETVSSEFARVAGQRAASAAIDAALHDLVGQLLGQPVWRLYGLTRSAPATAWTVSLADPDAMARAAETAVRSYRRLKLKLGGRDGLDLERVRAVRAITAAPLQVDVNEAWTFEEAGEALDELAALGVDLCEQPLHAGDPHGPALKARSPIPIFVDEDCRTPADVAACRERAHGVNVKLAKCGGIRQALKLVAAARATGLALMLGCTAESSLGTAAACQIASLFDYVDLDGNLKLRRDPWAGLELTDGVQRASGRPGLGVEPAAAPPLEQLGGLYFTRARPLLRRVYHRLREHRP